VDKGGIMAIVVMRKSSQLPDAGTYFAELTRVDIVEDDNSTEQILFQFRLKDSVKLNGEPFFVYKVCSLNNASGSFLRLVVEAILGRDLSGSEQKSGIDLEPLVGETVALEVLEARSKIDSPFVRIHFHYPDLEDEPPF
jgi:hypothetical protein